jgi:N-formylglutamate deformylase
MKPILVTIPHSGEQVPNEVKWLHGLPEAVVMCDVDRFVDRLYLPVLDQLNLARVICPWHRYVVDLNRFSSDVDQDSVHGSENISGQYTTGLHWVKTTTGIQLMKQPISQELHQHLVKNYFEPFHLEVQNIYKKWQTQGHKTIYHVDLHSMPSVGTSAHRDPGQTRAEIVVSDFNGKSCSSRMKDLVIGAFESAQFKVAYNWPYIGGRLTQQYGKPQIGQEAIQVELRRDLYMDEDSKQLKPEWSNLVPRLSAAIREVVERI